MNLLKGKKKAISFFFHFSKEFKLKRENNDIVLEVSEILENFIEVNLNKMENGFTTLGNIHHQIDLI